ncbi:MAG TPA: hypothetical protein VHG27_10530 [Xanthobacteraceae bacterium]|nr:hypothetical protein [Xanthobacteraceae bacterium]
MFALTACGPAAEPLPVPDRIVAGAVEPTTHRLQHFAHAPDGYVLGGHGTALHRILDAERTDILFRFEDPIVGIHATAQGRIIVSTDRSYGNADTPCRVHVSADGGRTFVMTKEIMGGCPIWWSMASDSGGNIYLGEYGPKQAPYSKTLWKSTDGGHRWTAIFRAPARDGLHIHRVAVDQWTADVWLTTGDGRANRGVYRSRDGGTHFERLFDSQATAIAFTSDAVYLGEDNKRGRISRAARCAKDLAVLFLATSSA